MPANLPSKPYMTLPELAHSWNCSETEIVELFRCGMLEASTWIDDETVHSEPDLNLNSSDAVAAYYDGEVEVSEMHHALSHDEDFSPVPICPKIPVKITKNDLLVRQAEVGAFEWMHPDFFPDEQLTTPDSAQHVSRKYDFCLKTLGLRTRMYLECKNSRPLGVGAQVNISQVINDAHDYLDGNQLDS